MPMPPRWMRATAARPMRRRHRRRQAEDGGRLRERERRWFLFSTPFYARQQFYNTRTQQEGELGEGEKLIYTSKRGERDNGVAKKKKIISNDATRLLELKTCHRTGKNARPLSTDNHELFPGSSPPVDRELSEVSRSEQQRKVRETRETHRGVEYKERTKIGCIKHAQEKKNSTTTNKNRPQARFSSSRRQGAGRRREQQRQQPEQE